MGKQRIAPPGIDPERFTGHLIVIEGLDGSGRSTQVSLLAKWLEQQGYWVLRAGLKRSTLVGPELEKAMEGNVLSPRTLTLFYAADFYDQLENNIVPALYSGAVVLADRYIFTLMARDLVRQADPSWVESLYKLAPVPDAVFFLKVSLPAITRRTLSANKRLDYWESGIDMAFSRDWYDCFIEYQGRMDKTFGELRRRYHFETIDGNRSIDEIQKDLRKRVLPVLGIHSQ